MGFILAVTDSRQGSEGPAIAISVRRAQAALESAWPEHTGLISRDLIRPCRFTSSRTCATSGPPNNGKPTSGARTR
jgi:hypothetical protein